MPVLRKDLLRFLKGHARAAEVIARERIQRLSTLTEEEARREYNHLCQVWQSNPFPESMASLDASRLTSLRLLRRRLDLLGRVRPNA